MSFPYQGAAVITGAGSGIGLATAKALGARGMDLALVDVSEERLSAARAALASNERRATTYAIDVADRAAVAALPDRVAVDHPVVSILMNNAGVALGGDFKQVAEADFDWLFEINFHAVVRLTRGFLPMLEAAPEGRIVNISSIFGVIAPPGQTAYAASKFAVRGFTEALRHELEDEGSTVGVTVVHPGGIATNIAKDSRVNVALSAEDLATRKAQADKLLVMPPGEAAKTIVDAIAARRPRLLIGNDAKLAATIQRFFPTTYLRFMGKRMSDKA